MSVFGTKVAVLYVIVGLVIAVAGGTVIEKMHMEKYVEEFILNANSRQQIVIKQGDTQMDAFKMVNKAF